MAKILIKEDKDGKTYGAAPVAVLTDLDRRILDAGIRSYCVQKKITFSDLSVEVGITRQNLYSLIKSEHIELQRLIKIQNILDVWIIDKFLLISTFA